MPRMKYSFQHIADPVERSRAITEQAKILIEMSNGLKESSRMAIAQCRERLERTKRKWEATPKAGGDAELSDGG